MSRELNTKPSVKAEYDARHYTLVTSALMIGVCLIAIGLTRVPSVERAVPQLDEHLLAIDAFLFMVSYVSSYFGLKGDKETRPRLFEIIAEYVSFVAQGIMVLVCILMVYRFV